MMNKNLSIYTIGHSNRTIEDFIDILLNEKIKLVIDVRSIPGSNKYPQYNKENLAKSLEKNKIKYEHISSLGGLRKKVKDIEPFLNNYWHNKSFYNYANYAMSDEFSEGLNRLIKLSAKYKTAIMCAEVLWWRCHRRIITDYLLARNINVYHIINKNNKYSATMNEWAVIIKNNIINYPK